LPVASARQLMRRYKKPIEPPHNIEMGFHLRCTKTHSKQNEMLPDKQAHVGQLVMRLDLSSAYAPASERPLKPFATEHPNTKN